MTIPWGKIDWRDACNFAQAVSDELKPTVAQLKCVGSVRRRCMYVHDIEFLVEPHFEHDLFDPKSSPPMIDDLKAAMIGMGTWVKGGTRQLVITDLLGRKGLKLEVFVAHPPAQWGSLLAIRTGPSDLSRICVTAMRQRGYLHTEGHVRRLNGGEVVPTPTEKEFFELAGIPMHKPSRRDEQAGDLMKPAERKWGRHYGD